jgi:THO complex subunit 1
MYYYTMVNMLYFKVVLDTFEAQPLTEDEGKANNLEQQEEATFSIKYLTSSNLMGLEVHLQYI